MLRKECRIDFSKETRMLCDEQEVQKVTLEMKETLSKTIPNFITECFFLTIYALHVGFNPILTSYTSLMKELHEVQENYKRFMDRISSGASSTVRIEEVYMSLISLPIFLSSSRLFLYVFTYFFYLRFIDTIKYSRTLFQTLQSKKGA
jgi:hypothetical protein